MFHMSTDNLQSWLQSVGTCECDVLEKHIMRFVRSWNGKRFVFVECVSGDQDPIVKKLARTQAQDQNWMDGSWKYDI